MCIVLKATTFVSSILPKATPNGCQISGPVDFQIGMWVGSDCHYIIIPLNDK